MKTKYIVGVDFGTTGSRTVIYDIDGNEVGSAYEENPIAYPEIGSYIYDGDLAIANLHKTTADAIKNSGINPKGIACISFSCARGCYAMYDKDGNFASPLILWPDTRAAAKAEWMISRLSECGYSLDELYDDTGMPFSPGWPITRIVWFKDTFPEKWEKVDKISTLMTVAMKAYCGDHTIDVLEDANWLQMLYARDQKPIPKVREAWGIDPGLLADFVPAGTIVGKIGKEVAAKTGLPEGVPVVCGAGDQECNVIGTGSLGDGIVSVYAGTCGTVIYRTEKFVPDPFRKLNICGSPGGRWQIEGSTSGTGGNLRWFRDAVFLNELHPAGAEINTFAQLDHMAEKAEPGSLGTLFLPYINGAGTPKFDGDARACFLGMNKETGIHELARAVMEGSTFELKSVMKALIDVGVSAKKLRFSGGGSNSALWNRIVADVFNLPSENVSVTESSCLGAAIVGAVGIGSYRNIDEAAGHMVSVKHSWEPDARNVAIYAEQYELHEACYRALSNCGAFKRIAAFESTSTKKR